MMITRAATRGLFPLFCAGAFAFWCACSSSSDDGAGTDVNADAGGAPDVGSDASSDAEGASDAGDDGASNGQIGSIFAISDTTAGSDGGVVGAYRVGAFFARRTSAATTTQTSKVGPCTVEKIGAGDPAKETAASAGTVHVEGGKKAVAVSPKSDLSYPPATGKEVLWAGGETVTARADGKDVPAFTASLTAPSKVTLTKPAIASGSLTIYRSADFDATFTGSSSGVVVLYFSAATETNAFTATCEFKVSDGSAKVPAAAFAAFPAVDGTFDFYVKESAMAPVSGWQVRFTASSSLVDPAGAAGGGQVIFK